MPEPEKPKLPSPAEVMGFNIYHFGTEGRAIREMVRHVREGVIDTSPPYQRGLVWSDAQQEALIDSLWRGLGMPGIYMRQFPNSSPSGAYWEVLDGQQRLNALVRYVSGVLPYRGQLFTELPDHVQAVFKFQPITVSVADNLSDEDALLVYDRINFCGVPHAAIDRRLPPQKDA